MRVTCRRSTGGTGGQVGDRPGCERRAMTTEPTTAQARLEPELIGRTVVVIGGSSGIGLATARRARVDGAEVILTGRNADRLREAALEVGARSTAAFDATDFEQLRKFFAELPAP